MPVQLIVCKNSQSLWNELLCVEWDVKPYTLTHWLKLHLVLGHCWRPATSLTHCVYIINQ